MEPFSIIMLVLSAAATAISTGIQYWSQNKINEENIDYAREAREDAQAFEKEAAATANAQTLQNFYMTQSPQAKMEMIKNAGLSPGLIYGNMAGTGGAGAAQKASAGSAPIPNLVSPFNGEYLNSLSKTMNEMADSATQRKNTDEDTKKKQKEIEEINAKIKETEANTKKIEEEAKTQVVTRNYTETQTQLAKLDIEYQTATLEDRIKIVEKELDLMEENIRKTGKEIDVLDVEIEWKPKLYQKTIDLNNAQISKIEKEKGLIVAQEALAYAEEKLANNKSELTREEKQKVKYEAGKLKEELDRYELYGADVANAKNFKELIIGAAKAAINAVTKGGRKQFQQDLHDAYQDYIKQQK